MSGAVPEESVNDVSGGLHDKNKVVSHKSVPAPPGRVQGIVNVNKGGPYGSSVLKDVQEDSRRVWQSVVNGEAPNGVGKDWYKASIKVRAYDDKPWTCQAVPLDGDSSAETKVYEYAPIPS